MQIIRLDPATLTLRHIDHFEAGLLRQVPIETDPGEDNAARERLFSKPMEGQGSELNDEWKQYVEPDLRHLFQSATETVSQDLKNLKAAADATEEELYYELHIPAGHLEQWLNALNQARLVMAARNAFTEQELDGFPTSINSMRDMNLFQMHFYAEIQHFLIREIG